MHDHAAVDEWGLPRVEGSQLLLPDCWAVKAAVLCESLDARSRDSRVRLRPKDDIVAELVALAQAP